ncbi:ribosome small subunit-dependent GTPase A [Macrococcus hajekii]|uniref:Small ribosomal subunit biogenesis GTPase RsgA n=1 Tax=Macrococcus hajekii TaxID=198482 RepID=A0A4R6BN70_9STAP|nr:ribosome small subunit-dependent GTPase A [Macrococcus hajekii]TDM03231.1 ribosome small subunit-dependent GTPase A [Macrococcus hajekii]GGA97154.1 putative ribosome biogenesis GTPase RsgA 2 [Macrococcus hajekii]
MREGLIYKALSGFYYVESEGESFQCRARGVFRKRGLSPLVGDRVKFQIENTTDGYITELLPRKNELVRPPVANIDQVLVVMSAKEPEFSLNLIDKFLVIVESYDITPCLIVTKKDLLNADEESFIQSKLDYYQSIGYNTYLISNLEDQRVMLDMLVPGINVLSGQSGVGKSSLINAARPQSNLETGIISNALNRGKHTTRHVELIKNKQGYIADTPGFSSLDYAHIDKYMLKNCFPEFVEVEQECKYRECLHVNEPKCAVKMAVGDTILASRYDHYLQMMNEIETRKVRY